MAEGPITDGAGRTTVEVESLPLCDFCGTEAHYDGKTILGPWGFMCDLHFASHGTGLGTGKGQRLIVRAMTTNEAAFRYADDGIGGAIFG